jgi:hypothetical protein
MKDVYRLENMTREQLQGARQQMIDLGINENQVDRILMNEGAAEAFNKRPIEIRQQFFEKVGAMDLGDIIRRRIETAPEEKPADLGATIRERIAAIGQQEKTAAQREQQVLAASVPKVSPQGQVMDTASAPPPRRTRSFTDFLKGAVTGDPEVLRALRPDIVPAAEAVAALGSQAVVAPVAATEQLIRGGVKPGAPDYFGKRMEAATYQPKTEAAKSALQELGQAFEASKLPPVITGAPPAVLPKATAPAQKPKISYQEFQAQRGIISPDPVGLPGMASVGAAGRKDPVAVRAAIDQLPVELRAEASNVPTQNVNLPALETHVKALNLPEPIQLTRGQATGDLVVLSRELNRRGELPNIAQRLGDQNQALIKNLTLIRDRAAPDAFGGMSDLGRQVIDGYLAIDRVRNDNISKLYSELRDAAGGQFPIDAQKFVNNADQTLRKQLKSEFLPPEIERQMQRYRDGSGMTFEEFEALRTNIASEIRKADRAGDGNRKAALSFVRDSLETLPLTGEAAKLKPLADAARKAAKERFDALKKDPAYNAAVNEKVAPDNFIETFVLSKGKGTEANVREMMSALGKGTPEQQAVAAGLMEIISRKAIDGQGNFSQAAYNKILRDLEPKLAEVFDADSARNLRNLGEISRKVMAQPRGGFANNSNTLVASLGEKAGKALEIGLNISTANLVPLGTMARQARERKAAQKFERESLEPLAGVKQPRTISDIFRGNQ